MADPVRAQYEAYPYPARDPEDERRRLVTGSPSRPVEIDHYLFGGARDWSRPLRALVAGGGTGDGLIQLAQLLTDAGRPYEITYLDLSRAARAVAEARARVRGLTGIAFVTGSLLDAAELGPFDYIDCCGVLHHLPDPGAGATALRQALAPGGGMGFMVYAPLGRTGVYPLQAAYDTLFGDLPPEEKLRAARAVQARLPQDHPFLRNPHLGDHLASDAGFYDLLLHSRDRAFSVPDLAGMLTGAGWALVGLLPAVRYDPARFGVTGEGLDPLARMAVAEALAGSIKTHVGYAVPAAEARGPAAWNRGDPVPVLAGDPRKVAAEVARTGGLGLRLPEMAARIAVPKSAAPVLAAVDGKRSLSRIAAAAKADPAAVRGLWSKLGPVLADWGLLHYSNLNLR